MDATWAAELMQAFRAGRLSADELWCVVLDCHALADPAAVVGLVLRSHAALGAPTEPAPVTAASTASDPGRASEPMTEAELFVLDGADEDLSIPA